MDADAKGQVGGLDVDVSVRRQYAVESRGWVCDVCEGRRSNEEVLREWREVCRAKGVAVDDDEDGASSLGAGAGGGTEKTASGEAEPNPEREPSDTNTTANIDTQTASSEQKSESLPSRDGVTPQQQVSAPVLSAPAEAAAPAPAPTPTRTTPVQTTTTTTSRPTTTSDAPWLDRAILGVLIALAFMIVRRLAKSEEY
ncbi:hypothetical protein CNMCM7691_005136 [Aspergillus felis]|uniref:Uncharacterized protein n=1 Tax=Aspergillus felis TaxID=1287682 RepID=A0A8H6R4T1_9EURO|nr:hypothetical protein CNMCM7691_005136 [Aspergillus felis]